MTDKMPDKYLSELAKCREIAWKTSGTNPSSEWECAMSDPFSVSRYIEHVFSASEQKHAEEIAALKAEHRAEMAWLCDEIECLSEYNLCEGTAIIKEDAIELIKQRISDD